MPTTLARRNPLLDVSEFRGLIEPLFSDFEAQLGVSQSWMPAVDVIRSEDGVKIHADIPGIKPEDVKIEVENGTLTVSGSVEESKETKENGGKFLRRERRYGSFSRSMTLPAGIDRDAIDATCENGVLEVSIPLPRRSDDGKIEIKAKGS